MGKKYRDYQESFKETLKNPAEAAAYLEAAFLDEDEEGFLLALRNVAEAHGVNPIAPKTGLDR